MIFYDCPTAPSPRRARIWLAEKQAPHEVVNINLMEGEQLKPAFKAINPTCTVPALKLDSGEVITQNAGIAAYLESAFANNPLLGKTSIEKGLVADWVARIEFEGLYAVAEALRNSSPGMRDRAITGDKNFAQIPELAERGLARLKLFFDQLNEQLEGHEFVTTETFTNADIVAAVAVDFARIVKVKAQQHHTNLIRWRAGLAERPSMSL
jgi:glutathione S-transferase